MGMLYYGDRRVAYRDLVGKPGGKRPLGTASRKREDNVKMDFYEVGWEAVNWIELAEDRGR
jgi:hypothetical protein